MSIETAIDMYDVASEGCVTNYVCDGCGTADAPRLLQITGQNGTLLLCYDGCIQDFKEKFGELAIPELGEEEDGPETDQGH
jgi:hypothetical protein